MEYLLYFIYLKTSIAHLTTINIYVLNASKYILYSVTYRNCRYISQSYVCSLTELYDRALRMIGSIQTWNTFALNVPVLAHMGCSDTLVDDTKQCKTEQCKYD